MWFLKILVCYSVLFPNIVVPLQFNLHLTKWNNNEENNSVVQHDCLRLDVWEDKPYIYEIVSYCMSEWPSKWNNHINNSDQNFTFADLSKRNITSEQLYLWSAPMDIVEDYQDYLDQLSISNETLLSSHTYFNCTLPRFGPMCQYSFDEYKSSFSSMNEIIYAFYAAIDYDSKKQTCYTQLQCVLGFTSLCIGWINICDGVVQCIDGTDEEHCWQLETNECKEDEFRCKNGQCIPLSFLYDNYNAYDCFDRSDEDILSFLADAGSWKPIGPLFKLEEISCLIFLDYSFIIKRGYDQQCYDSRFLHYDNSVYFPEKPNATSDVCWLALNCYLTFTIPLGFNCDDICQNETCKERIKNDCPDMFFMPNAPIAFGHIYFAYTKKYIIEQMSTNDPEYICYNEQLCGGFLSNKTLVSFNNSTCRRPRDFPLEFDYDPGDDQYLRTYITSIYDKLHKCNTILRNDSTFCNNSTMYQCLNSSKCIPQIRLFDNKKDCDYKDDELWISTEQKCPIKSSQMYVNCTSNNTCISRKLFNDEPYECKPPTDHDLCDDGLEQSDLTKYHISFPTICDNNTDLKSILVDEKNETDETKCEQWPCNNIYTRCNGIWNCFNGEDELDCHPPFLINCSLHSYVCISVETADYMCLSADKMNDGKIDCLGATDESQFCRNNKSSCSRDSFYCDTESGASCIHVAEICNEVTTCSQREDEMVCQNRLYSDLFAISGACATKAVMKRTGKENFLCRLFAPKLQFRMVHFSLSEMKSLDERIAKRDTDRELTSSLITKNFLSREDLCYRSPNLRIWLNKGKSITTTSCLCPSSYYGDRCQFQNERVSLTIQFRTFSDSWQTPFIVIVLLIDDSDERTIQSYEQFTYLPVLNCKTKFNIDLLYSTRPKNQSKIYLVHIDFYNKSSRSYQGSLRLSVPFPFLPVQRIATLLNIPRTDYNFKNCSVHQCEHGQCIQYFDDPQYSTFCQCYPGWSGRYCTIPYRCTCSSDSSCIGILPNNRSICVCPMHKWGSRCLLHEKVCQSNDTCRNGGQCIPVDKVLISKKKFTCICSKGFSGELCQISENKIILSFEKDMILSPSLLTHFLEVKENAHPENGTTFKTIPIDRTPVIIYWSRPFHIVFAEFIPHNLYYLILVQNEYNESTTIETTLKSSNRCPHISEVFNETFSRIHLIRRIKYYHLPCQQNSSQLSCFYDDDYMCLCQDFYQQRRANCFEFNPKLKRNCHGRSNCENDALCLQDSVNCPQTSMCVCRPCFYGTRCQLSSDGFGLSLDAILGSYIQPYVNIIYQPVIVQISITLTVLMTLMGLINGICSMMTFMNKEPRKTGCGFYLLGSSITTLFTTIIFCIKFWILLAAQMTYMSNRSFLHFQCRSVDFLLRTGLFIDQWLNACVAIERAIVAIKGVNFDKFKSRKIAKFIIPILLLLTMGTNIHEIIYRDLLDDNNNDEKRIWCIVRYSLNIQKYNLAMNIVHFCIPFVINLFSAIIIIIMTARLRTTAKTEQQYPKVLLEQFRQHKHLLITSLLLIILAIPRLIISFVSGCMKSASGAWLFLIGYFISFIPPIMIFFIFVAPSKTYKEEFYNTYRRYQRSLQTYFRLCR